MHVRRLKCMRCGAHHEPDDHIYVCSCHGPDGILDVEYDYAAISASCRREELQDGQGMWRYRPLLPLRADTPVPPLRVGATPLIQADRLAAELGLHRLWVKDEGVQPTGSLKDRASAMAVAKAREVGAEIICTASTGNAAAALAGLCASDGLPCVIFVPESAPPAKVAQMLAYGATVLLVEGNYDQAFDLCLQAADHFAWYNRNTAFNPYMAEGKKTVSLEICEQRGWQAPDVVMVSVGDGCILAGVHKGLCDLLALGWIDKMPRLLGVQAVGSNYLAEAWARGEDVNDKTAICPVTVADSLSVGLPRDRLKAMRAIERTGGAFVQVDDEAILQAIPTLARLTGIFAEPAGAAVVAGLKVAASQGLVTADDDIVIINTGNGLKDVDSARRSVTLAGDSAYKVAADLSAVEALGLAGAGGAK